MKRSDLISGLLLVGMMLLAPVVSASGFESRAFIDDGRLYGVSDNALLVRDLATGELTIHYSDGQQFHAEAAMSYGTEPKANPLLSGTYWLSAGGPGAGEVGVLAGSCNSEAAALQAAVDLVQSACANGSSASCSSALMALDDANDAYKQCIREFLEHD